MQAVAYVFQGKKGSKAKFLGDVLQMRIHIQAALTPGLNIKYILKVGKAHSDMSSGICVGLELAIAFYRSTRKASMIEYQIPGSGYPLFGCVASKLYDQEAVVTPLM